LTFKKKIEESGYILDYPNKEVRDSFSQIILLGTYNIDQTAESGIALDILMGFQDGDFDRAFAAMNRTLAAIPFNLYDEKESYYHSVLLTLLWACGLDVQAEERGSRGMADLVLKHKGNVWIMELKKAPPEVSLKQIKDRGYAEKYRSEGNVTLAGIEIDSGARNFKSYALEKTGQSITH
jgi:hypothetical protein